MRSARSRLVLPSRRARAAATTPEPLGAAHATMDDVVACYRLLLGRAPDPGGLRTWERVIAAGITPRQLAGAFIACPEYRAKAAAAEPEPVLVTAGGLRLFVLAGDIVYGNAFAANGSYEPHVAAVLDDLVGPGDVVVDVGANAGYFTLRAAAGVGPGGRVHAIEASARNVGLLRRSIAENGFENVVVHHVAASDREGELAVVSNPISSNCHVSPEPIADERVRAARLDDLVGAGLARLDVVKLDVEGYEVAALEGFRATLGRLRPRLVVEVNPEALAVAGVADPADLLRLAEALGYRVRPIERATGAVGEPVGPAALVARIAAAGAAYADVLLEPV